MNPLKLEPTAKTPRVVFDPDTAVFEISGRSIPEDSVGFYKIIMNWLDLYADEISGKANFRFELEYFNTSSSKCLLDLFRKLEDIYQAGKEINVSWYFDEDDEDMEETGEDYKDMLSVPFDIIPIEE